MTRPPCEHFQSDRCAIKLYGGSPHAMNCAACVAQGNNNAEFAEALFASREKTHPSNVRKVSGCCDSAENPAV
jgi:hypothetical protein